MKFSYLFISVLAVSAVDAAKLRGRQLGSAKSASASSSASASNSASNSASTKPSSKSSKDDPCYRSDDPNCAANVAAPMAAAAAVAAAANDDTQPTFTTQDATAVVDVDYVSVNTPNLAAALAADTAAGDVVQILTPAADATGSIPTTASVDRIADVNAGNTDQLYHISAPCTDSTGCI